MSSRASAPVEKPAAASEPPTYSASEQEEIAPAPPSSTESPAPARRIPDKELLEMSRMMSQ